MNKSTLNKFLLILLVQIFYTCSTSQIREITKIKQDANPVKEVKIQQIKLKGKVSNRKSEISGLSWYKDNLILLPQFPNRFSNNKYGEIYYIKKNRIIDFLSGKDTSAIEPMSFSINTNEFSNLFGKGSGFEAVTFHNNTAYFTIESFSFGKTVSYLIAGEVDSIKKRITLKRKSLTLIPNKLNIRNIGDESVLYFNNQIIPIYEANGKNVNPNPKVNLFDENYNIIKTIPFPNIEYRITDVTTVDSNNIFWAINYFYPGETQKLNPAPDELIKRFGIGKSQKKSEYIERLVKFRITKNKIELVNSAPIYIKLPGEEGRNWEGIARLNKKGFLIATDTYPKTILAFVKYKNK